MLQDTQIETLLLASTRFRGLVHTPSCDSTQLLAAAGPENDDRVFWADHQTSGRGRRDRVWHDEPATDLLLTLRVTVRLPNPAALPAALPVAVLEACELAAPECRLRIKWPNDLLVDGRKLCGVLIDRDSARPDTYRIGIGLNVNRTRFPAELEAIATSLALASGRLCDRSELLLAVARGVDRLLRELCTGSIATPLALFRERLGLIGRMVTVDGAPAARLDDIDFEHLTLAGGRRVPLAAVQSIRLERR